MYVITTNMGSSQVWSPSQDSQQAKRAGGPALDEEDDRRFDVCFVCLSGCAHACARCSAAARCGRRATERAVGDSSAHCLRTCPYRVALVCSEAPQAGPQPPSGMGPR